MTNPKDNPFKVGDRVRLTDKYVGPRENIGKTGTVIELKPYSGVSVQLDTPLYQTTQYLCDDYSYDRFELINDSPASRSIAAAHTCVAGATPIMGMVICRDCGKDLKPVNPYKETSYD